MFILKIVYVFWITAAVCFCYENKVLNEFANNFVKMPELSKKKKKNHVPKQVVK